MSEKTKDGAPRPAVPAATVLLVRKGEQPLEVFMVVRHHQIDFASGALVFPGGKVEAADGDARLRARMKGGEALAEGERAFRAAAIREAFEECGVLLARPAGSEALVGKERLAALVAAWQQKLVSNEATILDLVEAEDLVLASDLMVPFSHWVTPVYMPKRFDTWFFIAEAPADQLAVHDGRESVDSVWISPQQALADLEAGKRTIIFPTRLNLMQLGESGDVAGALRAARDRDIKTVQPWVEEREGRKVLRIQPEAGYPISEAPIDAIMRG